MTPETKDKTEFTHCISSDCNMKITNPSICMEIETGKDKKKEDMGKFLIRSVKKYNLLPVVLLI